MNSLSERIKKKAIELGFSLCGICDASSLETERIHLNTWLKEGCAGDMNYMHRNLNLRLNPSQILEGTKSIVVVALNYYPSQFQSNIQDQFIISKYAYGEDYHIVLKDKLNHLFEWIKDHVPEVEGRSFVDSAPIMERLLAVRAGLGWIGKNTLLINPKFGSFFFLGELFLNIPLNYDNPFIKNHCGTCRKCIEKCPSGAICTKNNSSYIDARKCISYITIEKRSDISEEEKLLIGNHIYGCDICQDVCPWNNKLEPHNEVRFIPHENLISWGKGNWRQLTEDQYKTIFKKSAVKRIKYTGLINNIRNAR